MTFHPSIDRLLAGPPLDGGAERLDAHLARLGALPRERDRRDLIGDLEASGLLGRGGAGFPVGRKWRTIAERPSGRAVVVVNGAEGEPASFKDRTLMAHRPHLVIDGAILAAEAVDADEIVFYVGAEHEAAVAAIGRAIERAAARVPAARSASSRRRSATSPARRPRPSTSSTPATRGRPRRRRGSRERGVGGAPTLVQNVESLAYAALIARVGERLVPIRGRGSDPRHGPGHRHGRGRGPGVREIELGTTVGEVAAAAGARADGISAVVLGGYFGTWAGPATCWTCRSTRR